MTGVSECSQQRGNLKDDGYIGFIRDEYLAYLCLIISVYCRFSRYLRENRVAKS
ncbi:MULTISPECIES: hypothetical protein [unclassified Photorhabdus]|uniref:hypothetical protein n=1 Tax=unclassified Photorhabdus TaxID=2620880 RepID=UPI0030DBAEBF